MQPSVIFSYHPIRKERCEQCAESQKRNPGIKPLAPRYSQQGSGGYNM